MSDTLCVLPFVHFNLLANGQASVCCASTEPLHNDEGEVLNVRHHSLEEIWRSQGLRDVRRQMLNGAKPKHCMDCYKNEERFGGRSFRTQQNALFLTDSEDNLAEKESDGFPKFISSGFSENMEKPKYFDLRFDNLCNLKCVICFGSASSQIERDSVHMAWTGEAQIQRTPNRFQNSKKWTESDTLFQELKDISSDVRFIQLAGGEPFLSALAMRWLNHLKDSGRAADVSMVVFTNLIRFDETIIDILSAFKSVVLHLSIDSVGEVYEYVRYPGKWSTIEKNAARLAEEQKGRLKNVRAGLNVTISVGSALTVCETFDWALSHGFNVNLNNATYPSYVATRFLPQATKERFEKMLREYADAHPELVQLPSQIDQWMTELREVDTRKPEHQEAVRDVMRFFNDMDKSRGLDFKRVMPTVYNDYVDQVGAWLDDNRYAEEGLASQPSIGTVVDGALTLRSGETYPIVSNAAGAIEVVSETMFGYKLAGWAADTRKREKLAAVFIAIDDEVIGRFMPEQARPDIKGGFGPNALKSGFTVTVARRGNKPAISAPIRLFALTQDGVAMPLSADADRLGGPVAQVAFSSEGVA